LQNGCTQIFTHTTERLEIAPGPHRLASSSRPPLASSSRMLVFEFSVLGLSCFTVGILRRPALFSTPDRVTHIHGVQYFKVERPSRIHFTLLNLYSWFICPLMQNVQTSLQLLITMLSAALAARMCLVLPCLPRIQGSRRHPSKHESGPTAACPHFPPRLRLSIFKTCSLLKLPICLFLILSSMKQFIISYPSNYQNASLRNWCCCRTRMSVLVRHHILVV
jgi:hypothetical protein